jgi:hypothetical protein
MMDVDETAAAADPVVRLLSYDGDSLELTVQVDRPSWLSFIDNWDPNWRAAVNGREVPIERLFGSYKAVNLAPGASTVIFSYRPWAWRP